MKEEEYLNIIGQNIVKYRNELRLKQIDLATKLNMEDSSLRRIEKGRTNPSIVMLKRIAEALGISVKDLLP